MRGCKVKVLTEVFMSEMDKCLSVNKGFPSATRGKIKLFRLEIFCVF